MHDLRITQIDIIPLRLPLIEPFVVSYGTFPDVPTVIVKLTTASAITGWGEATPDAAVTGETWHSVTAALQHTLAPALLGHDALNRESAMDQLDAAVDGMPSAKAALDIALHDVVARSAGLPVYALLGGRARPHLTISRVVSIKSPAEMAHDAQRHVRDGFRTVKLKVGDPDNPLLDAERIHTVREAVGSSIHLKVDVNQGWQIAGIAIAAIRASIGAAPDYYEQPVLMADLEGLAEVRRQTGAVIMADEAIHDANDMLRAVELRAADLVNIKLMKTGGLLRALQLNAVAEAAGIRAQVGTMVEGSIASAAGLQLATALGNVKTVEMGGPLMLREDIGDIRNWYSGDQISVPNAAGLGIKLDDAKIRKHAQDWITID